MTTEKTPGAEIVPLTQLELTGTTLATLHVDKVQDDSEGVVLATRRHNERLLAVKGGDYLCIVFPGDLVEKLDGVGDSVSGYLHIADGAKRVETTLVTIIEDEMFTRHVSKVKSESKEEIKYTPTALREPEKNGQRN